MLEILNRVEVRLSSGNNRVWDLEAFVTHANHEEIARLVETQLLWRISRDRSAAFEENLSLLSISQRDPDPSIPRPFTNDTEWTLPHRLIAMRSTGYEAGCIERRAVAYWTTFGYGWASRRSRLHEISARHPSGDARVRRTDGTPPLAACEAAAPILHYLTVP
jgi:hypothetical protein